MPENENVQVVEINKPRKKRRLGIAEQVFIGLGLGVVVGIFFGEEVAFLKTAGDAFIALLQITVIPYMTVALITSIGRLTFENVIALGLKAGSILLVLWIIGLIVILLSPLAFPDWPSSSFFSTSQIEEPKAVDFLQLYIPSNFFNSLANAVVPAVVVFSILFGLALIQVKNKERFLDIMSTVADTLVGVTGFVGKLAPYGVFAITASAAGTTEVADLGRLQVYIVTYVLLALILSFWLIPGLIAALTPIRYGELLRAFRGPLVTAFATGNILIVLPVLAADSKELLARTDGSSDKPGEQEGSSVDILIPAAFPFPNLGTLMALMFVLFGGWYLGSTVSVADYPTLAIAGLASLFGGAVLALPFLFDLLKLPADLFQVFVTVDVIASRFGTLLAAMHIIAIALIGTYALKGAITFRPARLLQFTLVSVTLLGAALFGIRAFYTYVYVEPYTKDQLLASLHLIGNPQTHSVFRDVPEDILDKQADPRGLSRINEQGVLRACYVLDDYPSAFFNRDGELVGFDVEMTHRFARDLDVDIEFMPVRGDHEASIGVNAGYCDVLMSLQVITPQQTERFAMTSSVLNAPVSLIVPDHRRDEFQAWGDVRAIEGLRVAVSDTPVLWKHLAELLPNATAVVYQDKKEMDRILASGAKDVDAIAAFAQEGAAWTILYPNFSLVTPKPTLFTPVGYAVARHDTDMLLFLDTWLLNARTNGTIDELYRYWMLGEVKQTQPPRWSVIRDVLHWID